MNEIVNFGDGKTVKVVMLKGEAGNDIESVVKTGTDVLVDTYTITLTDGSTHTFTVTNGKGITSVTKTDTTGLVDTYTIAFNDGTSTTFTVTNGKGITSVDKTGTNVLVDTYTITFNDGTSTTFTVTNGKGITSIVKTDTQGLVDTYTITFNDGTTETFIVTNGNGITSIVKTDTQGLVDTYTITMTDGTTATFTVTNAVGMIDTALSTSSTNAVQNKVVTAKINAMDANVASTNNAGTATKTYKKGEYFLKNDKLYVTTAIIASGATLTVGTNIEETDIATELTKLGGGGMPLLNWASPLHTFVGNGTSVQTYTATKDCYLCGSYGPNNSEAYIQINNTDVSRIPSGRNFIYQITPLKVKAGDVIKVACIFSALSVYEEIQ